MNEATSMLTGDTLSQDADSWFVYLFSVADYSAFKVGFSCNPLQRIYTFSRRYFERFDLGQSLLLRLGTCDDARTVEAVLKAELAEFRTDCPSWVPHEAGGHTEWFATERFGYAEERLQSFLQVHNAAQVANASDFVRGELSRLSPAFEPWACSQAQQVCDTWSDPSGLCAPAEAARSLRDWLDAYRYLGIPLFADDPAVLKFVTDSARLK